MTVSARLERQNTEPWGQRWHVQGCPGTRLSHEGSDRSLHPNESNSLSSYCFCISVLGPRNVYPPSDRENQPGQPSLSLPLAVGLQRPFWASRPPKESGFCLYSRTWVLAARARGRELEGDAFLPLCPFAVSVTAIGTRSCPAPA